MKKIIALVTALVLALGTMGAFASGIEMFGPINTEATLETFAGEWSATAYYDAAHKSMNIIDLDALIIGFEGDLVTTQIYEETRGVRYDEIATLNEGGYVTFAPDGEIATETFVVFAFGEEAIGAFQSPEGKMFEAGQPVSFYVLQPKAAVDLVRELAASMEGMSQEELEALTVASEEFVAASEEFAAAIEPAAIETQTESAGAMLEVMFEAFAQLTEEDLAELGEALKAAEAFIAGIPEEELAAAIETGYELFEAIASLTEEEVLEILEVLEFAAGLIEAIPEEYIEAAVGFVVEIFEGIANMSEEEIAILEGYVAELEAALTELEAFFEEAAAEEVVEEEVVEEEVALEDVIIGVLEGIAALTEEEPVEEVPAEDTMMEEMLGAFIGAFAEMDEEELAMIAPLFGGMGDEFCLPLPVEEAPAEDTMMEEMLGAFIAAFANMDAEELSMMMELGESFGELADALA